MTSFRTLRCKTRATTPWRWTKTYNGVAILTRTPVRDVVRNIPGLTTDEQSRVIAATLDTLQARCACSTATL